MDYVFLPIAMRNEAESFIKKLKNVQKKNLYDYELYIGKLNNINVIVGISGVGTINMSGLMHLVLTNYKIKYALNYGYVGGYGTSIHKGTIIVIKECVNTNSLKTKKEGKGKGIKVDNIEYMTFRESGDHKFFCYEVNKSFLEKIKEILVDDKSILYGRIASGDIWNSEYDKILYNLEKYNMLCEDMETAAVYQVAEKYKIPYVSIKVVSNNEILEEKYDLLTINDLVKIIEKVILNININ